MNRRRFFGLLPAAAALPSIIKAMDGVPNPNYVEPKKTPRQEWPDPGVSAPGQFYASTGFTAAPHYYRSIQLPKELK